MLALRRAAPLCLDMQVSCSGATIDGSFQLEELHYYLMASWVALQFFYNIIESCFKEPGLVPLPKGSAPADGGRFPVAWPPGGSTCSQEDQWPPLQYAPRWCVRCENWKPPRVHHSTRLGRCVLRMDHYCNATENIVRARNHGHFVLMVRFGNAGLLYAVFMLLQLSFYAWTPYWQIFEGTARIAEDRNNYWFWIITGAHLNTFNLAVGAEIFWLCMLTVVALCLVFPLLQQVLTASNGATVLETISQPAPDWIELPDGLVLPLKPGSFSQGSRLANLRQVLGPRWRLRLLCPVRGSISEEEETAPQLAPALALGLRELLTSEDSSEE
mmetsp:Transcript_177717/g.569748  ORF Transcript_177717/g.569748 Transcript_177717/m.569748 type:complete len:328 (+) Transcript_177717:327-1310(+)